MTIFLDTGVLVAWLNPEDTRNPDATLLMDRVLQGEWGAPTLIDHVLAETITLLRARVGRRGVTERFIHEFLRAPQPRTQLRVSTREDLAEACDLHVKYFERKLSLVDCLLILHTSAARGVLASYDGRFKGIVPVADA